MDQMPDWSHTLHTSGTPTCTALAREFTCTHLLAHGLRHLVDDVSLVVSELVTNAVTHAQTPLTVVLRREGGAVTLTVTDLSPVIPCMVASDGMALGGRGLVIVDALSRGWGVTPGSNGTKTVWASFVADRVEASP